MPRNRCSAATALSYPKTIITGETQRLESFIANGDTAEVIWVGKTEKAYGRYFTEVEIRVLPDGAIAGAKLVLRRPCLRLTPSIPRLEMERNSTTACSTATRVNSPTKNKGVSWKTPITIRCRRNTPTVSSMPQGSGRTVEAYTYRHGLPYLPMLSAQTSSAGSTPR